jgi:hypothetical protein
MKSEESKADRESTNASDYGGIAKRLKQSNQDADDGSQEQDHPAEEIIKSLCPLGLGSAILDSNTLEGVVCGFKPLLKAPQHLTWQDFLVDKGLDNVHSLPVVPSNRSQAGNQLKIGNGGQRKPATIRTTH